jgi:hypothetical protein
MKEEHVLCLKRISHMTSLVILLEPPIPLHYRCSVVNHSNHLTLYCVIFNKTIQIPMHPVVRRASELPVRRAWYKVSLSHIIVQKSAWKTFVRAKIRASAKPDWQFIQSHSDQIHRSHADYIFPFIHIDILHPTVQKSLTDITHTRLMLPERWALSQKT